MSNRQINWKLNLHAGNDPPGLSCQFILNLGKLGRSGKSYAIHTTNTMGQLRILEGSLEEIEASVYHQK